MPISHLNSETVKLIRSTQVISNVWSVVKELVENALDANAKNVEIYLDDNGLSMIKVRDDGTGIYKEDAEFMGLPSYTSKINNFKDLDTLTSYGFRGIALHSICTLADVSVTTKTEREQVATVYNLNHNGSVSKSEYTHGNNGTTVEVKDFCKNFPVRRKVLTEPKFLKKDLKNVEILIKDFSICNPEVRFVLQVNQKLVFTKPAAKDMKQALAYVIGYKNVLNLHKINQTISEIDIDLLIPKKDVTDLTDMFKSGQSYIFVNKRPIKHKDFEQIVLKSVIAYFSNKHSNIKKALFVINITVNPVNVDVNLEPNKDKVLLHNKDKIEVALDEILINYYEQKIAEKNQINVQNNEENNHPNFIKNTSENNTDKIIERNVCKEKEIIDNCIDIETIKNEIDSEEKIFKSFQHTIKPPVLSESDSDSEIKVSKRKSKSPCMNKINEEIYSEVSEENVSEEETLSQLPFVDLGEEFDLSDLKLNKIHCDNQSDHVEIGSDAWSRGHIPGGGGVNVIPVKMIKHENNIIHKSHAPRSAFGIYLTETRNKIMKNNPDANEIQVAKDITKQWQELSSEERGYYRDLAREEATVTPKIPRSQKRPLEDVNHEANKRKFIKFLENMKRDNKSEAPKNLVKKTIIPWNISFQGLITAFHKRIDTQKSHDCISIIGNVKNNDIWFVKYNGGIWLLDTSHFLKEFNVDVNIEQVNRSLLKQLLEKKISNDCNIENIMYRIYEL